MLLWQTAVATEQKELQHNLWQPAKMVDIVPTLKAFYSLLRTSKFAIANNITMFMPTAVQIYDGETTKVAAWQPPVLTGRQNNLSGLWYIPLTQHQTNQEPSNPILNTNNVFELANSNQIIVYYHVAAGYPIKPIWLATICKGFFATWLLLTEHAVNKHFLESTEMAKGHMHEQYQGL